MRRIPGVLAALAALSVPASASAQIAIMPKLTTGLGVGADVAWRAHDWVVLRAGGAFMPFEPTFTVSGIDFMVDAPVTALGAVDLHLGGTGFRVSGGVFNLTDDVVVEAELEGEVEIGGETWTRNEVGTITGAFGFGDFLPFATAGYGHAAGSGVGFFLEGGVAFFSESEVELEAEGGTRSDDEDFQSALRSQESIMERDLDDVGVWPIFTVGIRIGLGG